MNGSSLAMRMTSPPEHPLAPGEVEFFFSEDGYLVLRVGSSNELFRVYDERSGSLVFRSDINLKNGVAGLDGNRKLLIDTIPDNVERKSNKNVPGGYMGINSNGLIPAQFLPGFIVNRFLNLSDIPDAAAARKNLGTLDKSANLSDVPDAAAARQHLNTLDKSANLGDIPDKELARQNLGIEGMGNLNERVGSVIEEEGGLKENSVPYESISVVVREQLRKEFLAMTYPVGTVYENTQNSTSPAVLLNWPESSWEYFGQGRVLVGYGSGEDLSFRAAGSVFGSETVTLEEENLPEHNHLVYTARHNVNDVFPNRVFGKFSGHETHIGLLAGGSDATGGYETGKTEPAVAGGGEGQPHDNMQPSIVVYRWHRIS